MAEDSFAGKMWRSMFPRKADQVEVEALVTRLKPQGTTEELTQILSSGPREAGHVGHRLNRWLGRTATEADTRLIEALTHRIEAATKHVSGHIELFKKQQELTQLGERLDLETMGVRRAAEIAEAEHKVKMLELEARKAEIVRRSKSESLSTLEEQRAQLEIKKIEAQMADLVKPVPAAPEPPARVEQPTRMERMISGVEAELTKKRKEHANVEATAAWLRARLGAEIEFLRKTGKDREADGLQLYLDQLLDDLESDGLP